MKHSTGKPTKAEKARMDALSKMRCVACDQDGRYAPGGVEIHHLLSGNKRRGHLFTIPLCKWHHQGHVFPGERAAGMNIGWHEKHYGPSLARASKAFRARYGTDDELLERVNAKLQENER